MQLFTRVLLKKCSLGGAFGGFGEKTSKAGDLAGALFEAQTQKRREISALFAPLGVMKILLPALL